MSSKFIKRVLSDGRIDTRKYRYFVSGNHIKRISLNALDTTAALSDASDTNPRGWLTIYKI